MPDVPPFEVLASRFEREQGFRTVIKTTLECILRSAELTAPLVYIFTTAMRAIKPHIFPMFHQVGSHGIPTNMASMRKGIGMVDGC